MRVTAVPIERPGKHRTAQRKSWSGHLKPDTLAQLSCWIIAAVVSFIQPWRQIAADTKLDLSIDPRGFLSGAIHAWTDIFTMGQLQNQAYGYLFPQGLFFLITEGLPDWVAQRLWWTIVLGVGAQGFYLLCSRLKLGTPWTRLAAALLFALSPRTFSTLTSISSETWPIMLAPWAVFPFVGRAKIRLPDIAMSLLAIAMMGAVNATATAAACLPAALFLLFNRAFKPFMLWCIGGLLLSIWWLIPLIVLGKYAVPFTDYIESAGVTTRWLNLAEILRGTTSWVPFADGERTAGVLLVSQPYFVIITLLIAGLGLIGLSIWQRSPRSGQAQVWLWMLIIGILLLGSAHLATNFLDGAGAPLRNVHKFDVLVRIPLVLGVAVLFGKIPTVKLPDRRKILATCAVLMVLVGTAPAWSARMLPAGTFEEIPDYWYDAAEFINSNAAGTRTLVLPEAAFARQSWGWTRDEPLQALTEVPWAVRDSIPLVDPETIRGLDGLSSHPTQANLERFGIGAVLVRHDLTQNDLSAKRFFPESQIHHFGEVDVILLNTSAAMYLTDTKDLPRVAGGGEILSLLGSGAFSLVDKNAEIVSDTPMLIRRNFGTMGSVSAPLATSQESTDLSNRVLDYPSVGPLTTVKTTGGTVATSSSAADPSSLRVADPARSATAAVDGNSGTAWYPAPGASKDQWLELRPDQPVSNPRLTLETAGGEASVTITAGTTEVTKKIKPGEPTEIPLLGASGDTIRIILGEHETPVGIAEATIKDAPITRIVTVPDTSPAVKQFLFQRIFVDEGTIIRSFTAPRNMQVETELSTCTKKLILDDKSYDCGEKITLTPGAHTLKTEARWVRLTEPGFSGLGAPMQPLSLDNGTVTATTPIDKKTVTIPTPADHDRLLITARSANSGLQGFLDGNPLTATTANAGIQAFIIPAGASGTFHMSFAGEKAYHWGLIGGGVIFSLTVLILISIIVFNRRRPTALRLSAPQPSGIAQWLAFGGMTAACWLSTGSILVPIIAGLSVAVLKWTVLPRSALITACTITAAMWLARAPWPNQNYAGDTKALALICAADLILVTVPHLNPEDSETKRASSYKRN